MISPLLRVLLSSRGRGTTSFQFSNARVMPYSLAAIQVPPAPSLGYTAVVPLRLMNLRKLSRAAYDSFVAIHRKQVLVVTRYDAQSAHKPNASRSPRFRVGLNRWNTPVAVLPSSHGANSTRAVMSQGSNF